VEGRSEEETLLRASGHGDQKRGEKLKTNQRLPLDAACKGGGSEMSRGGGRGERLQGEVFVNKLGGRKGWGDLMLFKEREAKQVY